MPAMSGAKWSRRAIAFGLLCALMVSSSGLAAEDKPAKKQPAKELGAGGMLRVYFGTYSRDTKSKGIYVADVDLSGGKVTDVRLASESDNPSFVALAPNGKFLYAVNEVTEFGGAASGAVSAFKIDSASGKLTLLNQQPSKGGAPCHLIVDRTGKFVLTANYVGGSVCVHPIDRDGKLQAASSFVQHQGKSVNPRRQEAPHAHSINLDASNRYAFVADLGLDQVVSYHFDAEGGKLAANPSGTVRLKPGAGPRHFAFCPDGRFAFTNNEINSTVTSLRYDDDAGALTEVNTVSTLPGEHAGNSTAECQVHPNGKFVYVSNRGHNSIAIFAVDEASGKLTPVGHESTQGKTPRNFSIDPSGTLLLAENQSSDNVVVFRIDPETGKLSATGCIVEVPSPVCAKFWQAAE
jgi:6-phosphogluconolactonase